ncbi:MAG: hypothetical protein KGN80_07225, partial [Acidobacteriota bacterium]|nr:hypothetical protein [Acidobacteriota bacterium]
MQRTAAAIAMILSGLAAWAQDGGGHFRFSGPLSQFMAPGSIPAPVSAGLPFDIPLGRNGSVPETLSVKLRLPGASGPLSLELSGLNYAAGRLSGTVRLQNTSGAVVEGIRLDVTGATEELTAKDDKGNQVPKTRPQQASLPSPLFFGDLEKGGVSGPLALEVGPLKFTPETARITVHGVVSGLRYLGFFDVKGLDSPAAVDVDGKGRVYIADVDGQRIVRTDAEGGHLENLIKLPDQCAGVAVDPRSGEVWASRINAKEIYRFSDAGAEKGSLPCDGYASYLRFDRQGRLYASGGHVFCFANQKAAFEAGQAAGEDLYAKGMDVDS